MKRLVVFIVILIASTACLRLDSFLFNQKKLDSYQLDNYTDGELKTLNQNPLYAIPSNKIYGPFTLSSKNSNTTESIYAVYIGDTATIKTDTVILYCHGNKWHMDIYWNRAKLLAHTGGKNRYGVLLFDYTGYGMSSGTPSEDAMYADADACMSWLKSKGLTNDRLIVYGFSLGTAPSTKISSDNYTMKPSKLILEAPFASADAFTLDATKVNIPGSFVTNLSINNADKIKSVSQPFCWIHGKDDEYIHMDTHGQVVYDNYQGTYKEAHIVPGGQHSNVPEIMEFTPYLNTIEKFIQK